MNYISCLCGWSVWLLVKYKKTENLPTCSTRKETWAMLSLILNKSYTALWDRPFMKQIASSTYFMGKSWLSLQWTQVHSIPFNGWLQPIHETSPWLNTDPKLLLHQRHFTHVTLTNHGVCYEHFLAMLLTEVLLTASLVACQRMT